MYVYIKPVKSIECCLYIHLLRTGHLGLDDLSGSPDHEKVDSFPLSNH